MIARLVALTTLGLAACDHPHRAEPRAAPAAPAAPATQDAADRQEDAMSAAFDHTAAYRALLARLHITDPGDRVAAFDDLAAGTVRCFALRDGDGLRLKACVTPTGYVRDGFGGDADWQGLLAGAPDAATAARWIAWLATDQTPSAHGPRIPQPVVVVTPANAASFGYDPAQRAKVRAPEFTRGRAGLALTAWLHFPGATVPERWTVQPGTGGPALERRSAIELP